MAKVVGYTGLNIYAGQVREDFLKEWRLPNSIKKANEMRLNSPIVSAMLLAVEMAVRGTKPQISSDLEEDDPRIELIETALKRLDFDSHLADALSMTWAGFALAEIVWVKDESGRWIVGALAPRGQDTVYKWQQDNNGKVIGVVQMAAPTFQLVTIPLTKLVHYRVRAEKDNPEGRSLLRSAWTPYYYCREIQKIEAIGIERDLAGMPAITLPPGADTSETSATSDYAKAAELVRNVRNDEQAGIVLPAEWTFELTSTGGSRAFDTDKIIRRYESRILMSMLAHAMVLGQDGVGSLALSRDQSDILTMFCNSLADNIYSTFKDQVIDRMLRINGYDTDGIVFTHTPTSDKDSMLLADFLSKVGSMLTWTPQDETWLRQMVDMPEIDMALIDEERAKAEARKAQMARALQGKQAEPKPEDTEPEDGEEVASETPAADDEQALKAEMFVTRTLSDNRRIWEGRQQALYKAYLTAQKKRVIAAAKGERNG